MIKQGAIDDRKRGGHFFNSSLPLSSASLTLRQLRDYCREQLYMSLSISLKFPFTLCKTLDATNQDEIAIGFLRAILFKIS